MFVCVFVVGFLGGYVVYQEVVFGCEWQEGIEIID